jgi:Xaa-Pro aminopeptidase
MSNLARLRSALARNGFSAALISSPTNVFWLTGFTGSFGYVVVTAFDAVFLTDSRYTIQAQEQVSGIEIRSFSTPKTGIQALTEILVDLGVMELGFESVNTTYAQFLTWNEKLDTVALKPLGDVVENLRMVKGAEEIAKIKRSCELTDATFDHLIRLIQPGISEYEIQLEMEFFIRRQGGHMAFEPIVVSGPNSARPHGKATDKQLALGEFVTMDFGAKLDGYCADMTRTVVVGKADERTREVYNQVLKAQLSSIEMMKAGVVAESVDAKAREVFDEIGLAKHFGHGLGHGLGILVHDTGRLGIGSKTVLEPGQVWTVEPGVYLEGWGGCRIEDNVVVTEDGVINLTGSTKELLELPLA